MGTFLSNRKFYALALLVIVASLFAACAPNPRAQLISPDMVPEGAGEEFVRPTPTPVPNIAELTDEQIVAGLPEDALAVFPGDAGAGEQLTVAQGCVGCHNVDPNIPAAGPTWHNMANTAIVRRSDFGPAGYLYNSIIHPNEYVVDGYPANIMPQTYEEALSPEQITDIVTYLLTLRGDTE